MAVDARSAKFVTLFLLFVILGFAVISTEAVQQRFVVPLSAALASASGAVLDFLGYTIVVAGTTISSQRFAVDIRNGCNGVEAILILAGAMLAAPASGVQKLGGVFLGAILLQFINVVRIITLYLLGYHARSVFDLFHSAVWQVLIILVAVVIFVMWSQRVVRRAAS